MNGYTVACFRAPSTTTLILAMPASGGAPTGGNLIPIFIPSAGTYNLALGPNCEVAFNPDNTGAPIQFVSQGVVPTPVWTQLLAPSGINQLQFEGMAGQTIIRANGAAGTSKWSQYFR